ncbi:MAG: FeoA domain-containing protein [Dehalococcoidia bacterium]|nr:FeoA domain-containing protein [Dehalococcoidia bacterium]
MKSQEEGRDSVPVEELADAQDQAVRKLAAEGLVEVNDGVLRLTRKGLPEATSIVRRHRLAERLLADVLDTHGTLLHEKACKFEHLLDKGLDDSICTLLGHPRVCPHGSLIPEGRCCKERDEEAERVIAPLSEMDAGRAGKIAYIHAPEASRLQKLMSMGILPGTPIRLLQRFPSYVFEIRNTQFAVDRELANAIYVRLSPPGESAAFRSAGIPGGLRFRRGWWRRGRGR